MILKLKVPSSYWQISICAKQMKDEPDWDDDPFEKGIVKSTEGIYLATKTDKDIKLSIRAETPKPKFHFVETISLVSPDGDYEIGSPDTTNYGALIHVDGEKFEFDVYVNSLDTCRIKSVIFVTKAKVSLIKADFDSYIDRGNENEL
jgi:hypothetical protein